ncbi:RBBP9/YdeN family alpha/beta hydrolase [Nocardia xishanensis]|uniref:RBBP9/YdeN family alpha/beta hydrolase n=1 Tax=Nocardia xishanensis TaxID=238964 RepID=A0ABW7WX17_9NOCA
MSVIVISHMFAGSSAEVWYPAVQAEFAEAGCRVLVPDLPDPAAPELTAWLKALGHAVDPAFAGDTVLVGHSLGGVNVLRLLEAHDVDRYGPFKGVVLVASMAKEVGYDALAGFFAGGFDWDRIRKAAGDIRVLHAIDDPVTGSATTEHLAIFARDLGATVTLLPTGGHLPSTGQELTELPQATRLIREIL